jgi:hypothetical protein
MVYLTTLAVARLLNNELETIRKKAVVTEFSALCHFPGGTEENSKTSN